VTYRYDDPSVRLLAAYDRAIATARALRAVLAELAGTPHGKSDRDSVARSMFAGELATAALARTAWVEKL
jgi:hypothetical protein